MNTSTGVTAIAEERQRQVEVEGWTAEHDDDHGPDVLATAGACYAMVTGFHGRGDAFSPTPRLWPWDQEWWKPTPTDRRRELVKAGALIAAAIDVIDRAGAADAQPSEVA